MAVTAQLVKQLREMTGAGMMNCKKVLVETDGDIDKAVELLREKGLAKAAKKAGRIAAMGLVKTAFSADGKAAAIVEVNSETDFVAKNEEFINFVDTLAKTGAGIRRRGYGRVHRLFRMKAKEPCRTLSTTRSLLSART